jgi:hypothetical protein
MVAFQDYKSHQANRFGYAGADLKSAPIEPRICNPDLNKRERYFQFNNIQP